MYVNDGVTTIKPGQTTGNAFVIWSDKSSFTLLRLKNTQGSLQSGMTDSNSETRGRFYDGLGSNIVVQYSGVPIITLHDRITASEHVDMLGNQVYPMIQTLFPKKDTVFQDDDNASIHTARTVQSWFEEHEGELSIFPGQHNHQVCTSLNHSGQFWRLKLGTVPHLHL
jgi:hypothetical protein